MPTYGQYCPVAKAAEIVGERWTLLILRELLHGAHRFGEMQQGLPGISPSLLAKRLRDLERAGLIVVQSRQDGRNAGYRPTPAGEALTPAIMELGNWAARWNFGDPAKGELDPNVLMWFIRRFVRVEQLPRRRLVLRFDFRGARPGPRWLVVERGEVSVCLEDPGGTPDLEISADTATLHRVYAGRLAFAAALRDGSIELDGDRTLARSFAGWFGFSPFAPATREAVAS